MGKSLLGVFYSAFLWTWPIE